VAVAAAAGSPGGGGGGGAAPVATEGIPRKAVTRRMSSCGLRRGRVLCWEGEGNTHYVCLGVAEGAS
jgi:hypothetical protein